jgi:hypothetical protein
VRTQTPLSGCPQPFSLYLASPRWCPRLEATHHASKSAPLLRLCPRGYPASTSESTVILLILSSFFFFFFFFIKNDVVFWGNFLIDFFFQNGILVT